MNFRKFLFIETLFSYKSILQKSSRNSKMNLKNGLINMEKFSNLWEKENFNKLKMKLWNIEKD